MILNIKVIPRSKRTEFVEKMADGIYKFRVKSPPERGKANAELIKWMAKTCGIGRSEIKILSGHGDRNKRIELPDGLPLPW